MKRLAVRHFLVVVAVVILVSAGTLFYQIRMQYSQGTRDLKDILEMVEESYLPAVAAGVFFFDDQQLQLLAEGILLHPYVESVVILEHRPGENVPLITVGDDSAGNGELHTYPLVYRYEGVSREIGALHVTVSLDEIREQTLAQIRVATVANLLKILAFALIILLVEQRMVFRHLRAISAFMGSLDPEHPAERELVLKRGIGRNTGGSDELSEIAGALNIMVRRLEGVLNEKKVLLQELYHRTGNMMQSIRAILKLQSLRTEANETVETILRNVDNRILAMALVHQKLYQSENLSRVDMREYLQELAREVLRSYALPDRPVDLELNIEDARLLIDTAIPCGMVLSELLSNSLQHAFPRGRGGTLGIALHRTGDGQYELTVSDNGIGPGAEFEFPRDSSIGLQTVQTIVEKQLRGSLVLDQTRGVRWSIRFSDDIYQERVSNE